MDDVALTTDKENALLDRPIFLVGIGRCGSTILNRMLMHHPELAYTSLFLEKFPTRSWMHRTAMQIADWSLWAGRLRNRIFGIECWNYWNSHISGFSQTYRDLRADDVTTSMKDTARRLLCQLRSGSRQRPLIKFTGWTRLGFIKEVFPDARIIHIIRNPRPLVSSLIEVFFWRGWMGPHQWRWGPLTNEEQALWRRYDESFLVLAAIQWKKIMSAYYDSLGKLSPDARKDVMEIRYERLCAEKDRTINDILDFCQLEDSSVFRRRIAGLALRSQNHKWASNFTPGQQEVLEAAITDLGLDRMAQTHGIDRAQGTSI